MVAGTGSSFPILRRTESGSFSPCPVTVQTMRVSPGILSARFSKPAIGAALAGLRLHHRDDPFGELTLVAGEEKELILLEWSE